MRHFIKPNVALWMVFFFVFNLIGCGGGGGGSDGDSLTASLEKQLTSFNNAMEWVTDDLVDLMATVDKLNTAIATDDGSRGKTSEIGKLVDQFSNDADSLIASVEAMDLAEAGIQEIVNSETSLDSALITTLVGGGLVIYGLYTFAKKMKGHSDDMIEARKDRDAAADELMDRKGDPDAEEDFNDAKEEMAEIGEDATREFATKVTSDLILSPINPSSTTGVIIKHIAGDKLQDKLKVISATEECEGGYDSSGCKIGVDETDDFGSAVTPDGKATIVIGGDDMARIVVEEEISPDTFEEVFIDPTKIKDAGDEMLPEDDDNTGEDNDDPDDPVATALTLSAAVANEDETSITYSVAAAVSGVTGSTSVTISVENAGTGGSKQTLSADGTVFWTVTVLDKDAYVTVRRSDTGQQQSITLPGKTVSYDGTYVGSAVTTYEGEDCWCWDLVEGITVIVSGSTLRGDATGTLTGNRVSGYDNEYPELVYSGTINGNVMSGTWTDTADGCCSGTFSLTKQ